MARDSAEKLNKSRKEISNEFEKFNRRIKEEILKIEVFKMKKENIKKYNLLDFIGFIITDKDTDCMKDHDLIL